MLFFQSLADFHVPADWRLFIKRQDNGSFKVSILLTNEQVKDNELSNLPPMLLEGTPAELDAGFFTAIQKPTDKIKGLFINVQQHQKAVEDATRKKKEDREKVKSTSPVSADKPKDEAETKRKKFEAEMKRVDELAEDKKIGQATAALPKAEDYPEYLEEIQQKKEELMESIKQRSLF